MVDIKSNDVRDSLQWMQAELDNCSDRNSSDELSDDSNIGPQHLSTRRQTKQRLKVDEKLRANSGDDQAPNDDE